MYHIFTNDSVYDLSKTINERLKMGWQLAGGVAVLRYDGKWMFAQAMMECTLNANVPTKETFYDKHYE